MKKVKKDPQVEAIQKELDETKKIMTKNIENLIVRGEKLDKLDETSQELREEAHLFVRGANELKRYLQWRNIRLILLAIGLVVGCVTGLLQGASAVGLLCYSAFGALLGYGIGWLASVVQQKINPFSLRQNVFPSNKESKLNFPPKKNKELSRMARTKDKKTVATPSQSNDAKALASDTQEPPLTPEELALLEKAEQDIAAFKKQKADNEQKLIKRGALLEQLAGETTELKEETSELKQTAHKVERFEEAKNNHYTSILIGLGGGVLGVGYGFLMGNAWPLMVIYGVLAGTLTFGLSTVATKLKEKVTGFGDLFKGFSISNSAISLQVTHHTILNSPPLITSPVKTMLNQFQQHKAKPESIQQHNPVLLQKGLRL